MNVFPEGRVPAWVLASSPYWRRKMEEAVKLERIGVWTNDDVEIAELHGFDPYADTYGGDSREYHEYLCSLMREVVAAFKAERAWWHIFLAMEDAANVAAAKTLTDPQAIEEWSATVSVVTSLQAELPTVQRRNDDAGRKFSDEKRAYPIDYIPPG